MGKLSLSARSACSFKAFFYFSPFSAPFFVNFGVKSSPTLPITTNLSTFSSMNLKDFRNSVVRVEASDALE